MLKMKEVCIRTGLTEKAVRLYMEQGLIHPQVEDGIHRKSYSFTEKDVALLEDIATLRSAGFGIADIRQMLEQPEDLPKLLEEKQALLTAEIFQKQKLQEALSRLSLLEQGDTNKLANALRPAVKNKETKQPIIESRIFRVMVLMGLLMLLIWATYYKFGAYETFVEGIVICFLISVLSAVMAFRYGTCTRRARRKAIKGKGMVVTVSQENGFDISYARAGSGGAGTAEPGIGGIWQIVFMFWNELRPDCWYPMIQYTSSEGKRCVGTFAYGGLKHSWAEGEELEIAWDEDGKGYVYPLFAPWLMKKAVAYGLLAVLMLGITAVLTAELQVLFYLQ